MAGKEMEDPGSYFSTVLVAAAKLPGVRINRETYLRKALARHCPEEQIKQAIEETPAAAGIPLDILEKAANDSIKYETAKVSAASAAAGLPGLLFLPATVPADLAQYMGHMLRISQKLAYLYSWPDLFSGDDMDDATEGVLTLFVGVMFGAHTATTAIGKVAEEMSKHVAKSLPKKALTKGIIYPLVKKIAGHLGKEMTKQTFARTVSKAVPVVGAVVSGGLTFATFRPMAKKLKNHLAELDMTKPTVRVEDVEVALEREPSVTDYVEQSDGDDADSK
ncbi:EcsC family protein [Streptomyces sp. SMS_SU21]|uniref:EcsC family protein n=1 Tax=Streptomyces sp. SMS_SU21 TaxID=2069440 RepID=UPI001CD96E55|nr:EcsC family protein [Streptomyces sp. SMS_SU21]MCA2201031.1 EcsC family protein [Streptomyces sp. SMS_SU21]